MYGVSRGKGLKILNANYIMKGGHLAAFSLQLQHTFCHIVCVTENNFESIFDKFLFLNTYSSEFFVISPDGADRVLILLRRKYFKSSDIISTSFNCFHEDKESLSAFRKKSLQILGCKFHYQNFQFTLYCIYRAPHSTKNVELLDFMNNIAKSKNSVIFCGDYNIDITPKWRKTRYRNAADKNFATGVSPILRPMNRDYSRIQTWHMSNGQALIKKSTLDHIWVSNTLLDYDRISELRYHDSADFDHRIIEFKLLLKSKPKMIELPKKYVESRRRFESEAEIDLANNLLLSHEWSEVRDCPTSFYNEIKKMIKLVLDKFCPIRQYDALPKTYRFTMSEKIKKACGSKKIYDELL